MKYPRSERYTKYDSKMMGPNPLKLAEELLEGRGLKKGMKVCDLGSGQGITSMFIHKEYGPTVYAADLWSDSEENARFFRQEGIEEKGVIPVKADATDLPFEKEYFDALTCIDSWNYFGRDKAFLDEKISPFIKKGGRIYLAITASEGDYERGSYPSPLLLSWNEDQLDYIRSLRYWKEIFSSSSSFNLLEIKKMESDDEVWEDWLKQDNEYAIGDRKSMENGGGDYICFVMAVLEKKN